MKKIIDVRVGGGKYKLGKKIGAGAFGELYIGKHVDTDQEYAVKLEQVAAKHQNQLLYEAKVYKLIKGGVGIPNVHWSGIDGDYNVMVMDLLGPTIEDLLNFCDRKFTLKTTLMLAEQMLSRVEYLHSRNFLHRDIKPDNFLVGIHDKTNLVYMIDLGLARRYRDPKTKIHIPFRDNKGMTGTARYSSVNTHLGIDQSRRDDLEGLGYVFVYFLRGKLPWQSIKAFTKKEKYEKIMEKKMATPIEVLCKGFPCEFCSFLHYARGLGFEEKPDYAHLRRMFKETYFKYKLNDEYIFDWTIIKEFNNLHPDEIDDHGNVISSKSQEECKIEEVQAKKGKKGKKPRKRKKKRKEHKIKEESPPEGETPNFTPLEEEKIDRISSNLKYKLKNREHSIQSIDFHVPEDYSLPGSIPSFNNYIKNKSHWQLNRLNSQVLRRSFPPKLNFNNKQKSAIDLCSASQSGRRVNKEAEVQNDDQTRALSDMRRYSHNNMADLTQKSVFHINQLENQDSRQKYTKQENQKMRIRDKMNHQFIGNITLQLII